MLIDWVTARIPLHDLSPEAREAALSVGDRITRYCPRTGEEVYTTFAWDSMRSDSHQLAVKSGTDLWVQGSPARVMGDGDTVFGSGASAALDLEGCVQRMVEFVSGRLGAALPPAKQWLVSRIDVTGNLQLQSLEQVHQALTILRSVEGGRYKVSNKAHDTVYWSHRSKHRKGKAYAKGPHLVHLMKQKTYSGRRYSAADIEFANRLLRLELTLGREFFKRREGHWSDLSPSDLTEQWRDYFERMIGGAEMSDDELTVQERIEKAAPTEGQGRAAHGCWVMISQNGWHRAKSLYPKNTWYRHMRVLRAAGLGDADISAGRVVQLRRKVFEARLVRSWSELAA